MNLIKHVAIIMDGNGRWGLKKRNNRNYGHTQGLKTLEKIVNHSIEKKIQYLTLFAFSTENWKRPNSEINFLFSLLNKFLKKKIKYLHNKHIKLKFIGSRKKLDSSIISNISNAEKLTKKNNQIQVNIALNYGSRDEILESFKKIKKNGLNLTKSNLENNLYTKKIPDPDILIRTGNTHRLSNFMLWQIAYTEIFFVEKLWPDFNIRDFDKIINNFKKINRRFGAINEEWVC